MARHHTPAERSNIVAAFHRSGRTARQFASEQGVSSTSLTRWASEAAASGPAFVRLEKQRPAPRRVVVLAGEARIEVERGFDAELLREVVAALCGGRS